MPGTVAYTRIKRLFRTALIAVLLSIAIQGLRSAHHLGQTSRWEFSWFWVWLSVLGLLSAVLFWTLWQRVHPNSATKVRNLNRWSFLRRWILKNKAVTFAALGVTLTGFLATSLQHLGESANEKLRNLGAFLNETLFTFTLFGYTLKTIDVLTLECLGFILGSVALAVYNLQMPSPLKPGIADHQQALANALRSADLPLRDLQLTLNEFRKSEAAKPECKNFRWAKIDAELNKFDRQMGESRGSVLQTAAHVVEIAPRDEVAYERLSKDLFDVTKPGWRHLLFILLLSAFVLTALPVLLRTLLLFFPALKGIGT